MDSLINDAKSAWKREGLLYVIKTAPGHLIRKYGPYGVPLTSRPATRNGVVVEKKRYPNDYHLPTYEQALSSLHTTVTKSGDTVAIVGGGYGVSAFHAAHSTDHSGKIIIYEADGNRINTLAEVAKRYEFENYVELNNGIVGPEIRVKSAPGNNMAISDLPECDVLELDCEGAEYNILSGMEIRPRDLFIEIHPNHRQINDKVPDLLDELGYVIHQHFRDSGKKITEEQFNDIMEYDYTNDDGPIKTKNGINPPVVWARKQSFIESG